MSKEWWSEVTDIKEAKKRILNAEFVPDDMLKNINFDNKTVLDFGCGIGRNLKYLVTTSAERIIGFDYPNMIELSKEFLLHEERSKILFMFPPLWALPNIDIIIASLVFQHINDIYELTRYLHILNLYLNKNGTMYVNSRGYIDDGLGIIWKYILDYFTPITHLDDKDGTENHQKVLFIKKGEL